MPISSGATVNQGQGSYLKRYLCTLPQEKRKDLEKCLEAAFVSEAAGGKGKAPVEGLQEDQTQQDSDEDSTKQTASKKSSTCTML